MSQHVKQEQNLMEMINLFLSSGTSVQTITKITKMINKMPGGFIICQADFEKKIIYANQAVLKMFNCNNLKEFLMLTKHSFRGMVHPDDLLLAEQTIEKQKTSNSNQYEWNNEYRIIQKGGNVRWVKDYGHSIQNIGVDDVLYIFLNEVMEKNSHETSESVAKNTFLANISHEIRTPMNAIVAYTSLAKIHIGNPEKLYHYLEKVEESSNLLLKLIEDIINISHIESKKTKMETGAFSLKSILQEVCIELMPMAENKNIYFYVDISELTHDDVYVDSQCLKQIVSRLVDNAVKYTKSGGKVVLSVLEEEADVQGFSTYRISVEDNGIGIPKEFLEHIYKPFEREMNTTISGVQGAGLGLAITKNLVDIMEGTIEVVSEVGKGSTFTVILKLRLQSV